MKIAFGCDHGGFAVKEAVVSHLKNAGYEVIDFGTFGEDSCDYPDYALKVAKSVASGEAEKGVLICGTGIGMSIAANKVKNVRCAHVNDAYSAEFTRRHNDSNVIALGARIATVDDIIKYIDIFLSTPFEGGRHERRVNKISQIESEFFK